MIRTCVMCIVKRARSVADEWQRHYASRSTFRFLTRCCMRLTRRHVQIALLICLLFFFSGVLPSTNYLRLI